MKCPKCNSYNTKVVDSRTRKNLLPVFEYKYRKHKCKDCDDTFLSVEVEKETFVKIHNMDL